MLVSLVDLDCAVKLLAEFVRSVDEHTDFRPINFHG